MAVTRYRVIGQERPCPLRFTLISLHPSFNPGQASACTALNCSHVKCIQHPHASKLQRNKGKADLGQKKENATESRACLKHAEKSADLSTGVTSCLFF